MQTSVRPTSGLPYRYSARRAESRLSSVQVVCGRGDNSVRVRGDVKRVYQYVSDFGYMKQWYPGTQDVKRVGNSEDPIKAGTRFYVERKLVTFKVPMTYDVVDYSPTKSLVVTGLSEAHTSTEQYIFMQDPTNPQYTIVRYVADITLREWRSALQPIAGKLLAKLPEEALNNLGKVLNGPQSPLFTPEFEAQFVRAFGKQRPSAKAGTSSSSGSTPRKPRQTPKWDLGSLFGSTTSSSSSSTDEPDVDPLLITPSGDAMGYYSVLGLAVSEPVTAKDIKTAYRKAVMDCHPDKHIASDARTRDAAAQRFQQLTKAYDTLRDPDSRRLYDDGKLFEMSESF